MLLSTLTLEEKREAFSKLGQAFFTVTYVDDNNVIINVKGIVDTRSYNRLLA